MKSKLGKLKKIETTDYSSYKGLLKKKIIAELGKSNTICNYILIDSMVLNWKGEEPNEDQPLFYLGQTMAWKKDIKSSKEMDLKAYSYGQCKLLQVGTTVQVFLCPEKGKLTQATLLKPIKKIFKTFKPKVFFEVVATLDEVDTFMKDKQQSKKEIKQDIHVLEDETTVSSAEVLQTIGTDLQKYHVAMTKLNTAIDKAIDQAAKTPLLVKQNQILKRLKHLCASWTTEIEPQAASLIIDEEHKTWQKIYQKWQIFFAKRKVAKGGDSSNQDAIKAEEEHIYAKALEDLEQFQNNLEKGDVIDPSVIETNIENLEQHLTQWKAFVKGKKITFPEELKALEELLVEMRSDWKTFKPLMENYHQKAEALDEALEGTDVDLVNTLYKELESINEQMASLA